MEVKPGYKQTDVGVIPEEWEVKSLGSVLSKGRLGGNYANQDAAAELPLMKMGNLARGYFDLSKVQFITPGVTPEPAHRLVYGDVLFNTRNTLDLVGKVAIWRDELPVAYYNSNLMRLEFDPEQVCSNEYANYSLNTEGAVSRLRGLATGTTSVAAIYTRDLMKLQVLVPPKPEQGAIADALSDVDGLLGGLDRLIAKKRDLKQAAMQQLLTGQTRLPGFHDEWVPLNMADNSNLKARIGWQGLTTAEYLKTGDYFLVTGTDFSVGRIAWSSCCFVAAERYTQDRNIQLQSKDILLTKDGTIGKVAYVDHLPGPATLNSGVFVIRPKGEAYEPHFFYYILTSRIFEEFLNKLAAGSTISHLYQKDFVTFSFLVPPTIPEQTAIAEVLTEMDAELAALEQRREKTRALKQAMMQELLTGRTRLV